jgi:hypothetical protein
MAHHGGSLGRPGPHDYPELLFRTVIFAGLVVGGVVATTAANRWWTTALAIAAVVVACVGIVLSAMTMLANENDEQTAPFGRAASTAVAALAAVAVALAVVIPDHEAVASATAALTAPAAAQTVRDFLVTAAIDDDAYIACQYLTLPEQREIARRTAEPTCRDAFTATPPAFAGIQSVHQLRALPLRTSVVGRHAGVTIAPRGQPPATFGLGPATPAELSAFEAPQSAWRIESGATAVLPG